MDSSGKKKWRRTAERNEIFDQAWERTLFSNVSTSRDGFLVDLVSLAFHNRSYSKNKPFSHCHLAHFFWPCLSLINWGIGLFLF